VSLELEAGSWKLEAGSWKLEAGSWKLEAGSWKLESVLGVTSGIKHSSVAAVFHPGHLLADLVGFFFQLQASSFQLAFKEYSRNPPRCGPG
jgi:hypothetical protein